MARRKKSHKAKTHKRGSSHRSSRGMFGAIDTTNILGVIAGAVGGKLLDKVIPESIDEKISAGLKVAVGIALPMVVKSGKAKNVMSGVGSGLVAVGVVELLNSFGVLAGLGARNDDMLVVSLEGVDDLPVINGLNDGRINVVNGLGEDVLAEDVLAMSVMDEDENQNEFN